MMGYGGWGMGPVGWMFMGLFWIIVLGLIVWAAVALLPRTRADQPAVGQPSGGHLSGSPARETPTEILDRRFASGELTIEQYREARDELSARHTGPNGR